MALVPLMDISDMRSSYVMLKVHSNDDDYTHHNQTGLFMKKTGNSIVFYYGDSDIATHAGSIVRSNYKHSVLALA